MTRVLIADDHPLVLRGVDGLFDPGEFDIVALCADGATALEKILSGDCEIAVVDLNMPGRTGLEILRAVRVADLKVKIVLLTANIDDDALVEAIGLNVEGLVLKETAASLLVTCVRSVRDGVSWVDRELMSRALRALTASQAAPDGARLTPRETDVARLVGAGLRNKEIAARTNLAEGTVKMHLHNIYGKVGVGTRTELAIYVRNTGLS